MTVTRIKPEVLGGVLLILGGAMALVLANSPLADCYALLLDVPVAVSVGSFQLSKPILLWINDGLMAVFFFMIGLELKREIIEGELSDPRKAMLPAVGAIGGMLVPALVYTLINYGNPIAMQGWAIPMATDIAFALGILLMFGERVPHGLKVFLVSLATFDDIGAIVVIALLYTSGLSMTALGVAMGCLFVLFIINRRGVSTVIPYILVGVVMWTALLKSGVHATLSGILLAQFIPLKDSANPDASPLRKLEHDLHSTVFFVVLPLFAFANSGIPLMGGGLDSMLHPVPIAIALGLFLGKQLGIFGFVWLSVRLGFARLPERVGWGGFYGVAVLCGVGFTMSLFIGSLAFEGKQIEILFDERLGIIVGSALSAVVGYIILHKTL